MPVRHVDDALLTAPGERGALVRRLHAGGRGVSPTETEGLPTPVRVPGASNLGRAGILFPRRRTSCVLCYPCLCGRHMASSGPPWVCEATWTPSGHVILTHLLSFEWGRDQETAPQRTGPGCRPNCPATWAALSSRIDGQCRGPVGVLFGRPPWVNHSAMVEAHSCRPATLHLKVVEKEF